MRLMVPAALAATTAALAVASGPNPRQPVDTTVPPVETVTVAPGTFDFRLPGEYLHANRPADAPKHATTFRRGFEIMKYQVSATDYAVCVAEKACEAPEGGRTVPGDLPVTGVSYRNATAYAAWLSAGTGDTWRLPTDAEWAFAAAERLHDDALELPQDTENPAIRWLARYRAEAGTATRDAEPKPLGYFGPNSKGLEDLAGNVWEWTTTCYVRAMIAKDSDIVHRTENCGVRVVAGRHRSYMSTFIRDGRSGGCAAGLAPDNLGFRLVREKPSLVSYVRDLWGKAAG